MALHSGGLCICRMNHNAIPHCTGSRRPIQSCQSQHQSDKPIKGQLWLPSVEHLPDQNQQAGPQPLVDSSYLGTMTLPHFIAPCVHLLLSTFTFALLLLLHFPSPFMYPSFSSLYTMDKTLFPVHPPVVQRSVMVSLQAPSNTDGFSHLWPLELS